MRRYLLMVKELVEPVARDLVARLAVGRNRGSDDHRKTDRLTIALPLIYTISGPVERFEGHTNTINISCAGIQIVIPEMVSPQTACEVSLSLPQHSAPLVFHGRIAWCRIGQGDHRKAYEVGVAFLKPSSYTDPTFAVLYRFIATKLLRTHLGSPRD